MAARAIWKGILRLGELRVPVKLYSAVVDRDVHFHLLHARDRARVRQHLVDPRTGEAVRGEEVRRGYPVERGLFVVLRDEELDAFTPAASREIVISRFVPSTALAASFYERPYYLGPDGNAAAYFALRAALAREDRIGIARFTMRKKRYCGALRGHGEHLMLMTLHYAGEVVSSAELAPSDGARRKPDAHQRALAEQLVSALHAELDPREFRAEHRARVRELVAEKASGGRVRRLPAPRPRRAEPLAQALRASLRSVKQSKKERASA